MAVSRRLRFEILRRDGHACRYCGATAPDVKLTVDHVIPVTLGGGDDPNNLVTACAGCNAGKSSISPDSGIVGDVDAAALLFARAMELASERRRDDRALMAYELGHFDEQTWGKWKVSSDQSPVPKPDDWKDSVERFISLGLDPDEDLPHLAKVAMDSQAVIGEKWRYFCGCCWREITERQELARRLIEDGEI